MEIEFKKNVGGYISPLCEIFEITNEGPLLSASPDAPIDDWVIDDTPLI